MSRGGGFAAGWLVGIVLSALSIWSLSWALPTIVERIIGGGLDDSATQSIRQLSITLGIVAGMGFGSVILVMTAMLRPKA